MLGFLIVVPAYNEEECIKQVVHEVQTSFPTAHLLVVDDGSSDETSHRVLESGCDLLRLPFNLGVGGACQAALRLAEQEGYQYVVRLDGDGQHYPNDVASLLNVVMAGEADVAIGSRFVSRNGSDRTQLRPATYMRMVGIRLFSTLVSFLIRRRITDPTSGFRCYNRQVIRYMARYHPQDYPEVESVVLLHRAGFRVRELPITVRPRLGGISSINARKAVYYVFRVLLATTIAAIRQVPPGISEASRVP